MKQILRSFEQMVQRLLEGPFDKSFNQSLEQYNISNPPPNDKEENRELGPVASVHLGAKSVGLTREIKQSQGGEGSLINNIPETLIILDGRQHASFRKAVIRIGRHLDNDIVLDTPEVSRFHGQISWRNGRALLRDLSSATGIYLNGERTVTSLLYNGDVVRIGSHSLIFGTEEDMPKSSLRKFGESPTSILKSTKGE